MAAASDGVRADLLSLVFAVWAAGWMLGPTVANGTGVLRSQYFALLPLDRRRVGGLLLVTMFFDVGPALTLVALAALAWHALALDPASLLVAVPGVLLLWVFAITLSRLVFRALGAAMHSRLGVEIASVQWGLILAGMFFGWMAVQPAFRATLSLSENGLGEGATGTVLAVLPTSWPLLAVEAAAGSWTAATAWLGGFALVTAGMVAVTSVLLAPRVEARGLRRRVPLPVGPAVAVGAGGRGQGGVRGLVAGPGRPPEVGGAAPGGVHPDQVRREGRAPGPAGERVPAGPAGAHRDAGQLRDQAHRLLKDPGPECDWVHSVLRCTECNRVRNVGTWTNRKNRPHVIGVRH
ncbi:hypothetical protein [Nocardiopsis quinghaiensis]|uniref:hypothetical protein n=1 Tax=Nocardiopsis quinghaiensis TaxID=464995 RepID=UPI001CC26C10|nr:hypothetical protein [Nocardiopsis quinghaiensis]